MDLITKWRAARRLPASGNPEDCRISVGIFFSGDAEPRQVALAQAEITRGQDLVNGAANAKAVTFTPVYELADTLANLEKAPVVLEGAVDYALTNEPGNLGPLTKAQIAIVEGATDAAEYTWEIAPSSFRLTPQSDTASATEFDGSVEVLPGQTVNTWNNGDKLTGEGVNPILNAEFVNAVATTITPSLLVGVETVRISALNANAVTINTQNVEGLKHLEVSNLGNNLLTVGALNNALESLSLDGSGAATVTTVAAAVAGADDAVRVRLNNQTNAGNVTFATAGSTTAGYETINFESNGAVANTIGNVTSTGTTTVTFEGSANITTGNLANNIVTVDASLATGDVRATVGNGNVTFTGGEGNDRVTFAANFNANDIVDGGAGVNAIAASSANLAGITALDTNISNVQTLIANTAVANGATFRVDHFGDTNNVNRLVLAGDDTAAANNMTIRFDAGENSVDFVDSLGLWTGDQIIGAVTVEANGTANTDRLVLNLDGDDLATAAVETADVTIGALNLNSNNRPIEHLEIRSDNATVDHSIGAITLPNTVAVDNGIIVTGNSTLTMTGAITADAVDASGLTGGAAIVFDAGQASGRVMRIVGSDSGADTLIGSAAADNITTGAGNSVVDGAGGGDAIQLGSGQNTVWYATTNGLAALDGGTNPLVSGFDSAATVAASDLIFIAESAALSPSAVGNIAFFDGSGTAIVPGGGLAAVVVSAAQGVAVNTAAGQTLFKLTTAVSTAAGDDAQDLFNLAIGGGSFNNAGIGAGETFLVTAYDQTNGVAVLMEVTAFANTTIDTGDVVDTIGTISMTAAEYANFGANQVTFF